MDLTTLKNVFFIGATDAIDAFISTLKPRCIKPSEQNITTVDGATYRTVYNTDNDTYIAQDMTEYKKDIILNTLEPADSFVKAVIHPAEIKMKVGAQRRRKIKFEMVSQHCIDLGNYIVPEYNSEDNYYLYVDNSQTVKIHGTNYGVLRRFARHYDDLCTLPVIEDADSFIFRNPTLDIYDNAHQLEVTPNHVVSSDLYLNEDVVVVHHVVAGHDRIIALPKQYYDSHADLFETCRHCGSVYIKAQHQLVDNVCPLCRNVQIYEYHSWDGSFIPRMASNETNCNTFFGIEIESLGSDEDSRLIAPYTDLFHLERDGSLRYNHYGLSGFEMISQPLSWNGWVEQYDRIQTLFDSLLNAGRKSHDTSCCGFHIHVSTSAFNGKEAIERAGAIVMGMASEMKKIGRRKTSNYSVFMDDFSNKPDSASIDVLNSEATTHHYAINYGDLYDRRTRTMEFRFPKGTLNTSTIYATIQFIKNIVDCANSSQTVIHFYDLCHGEYVEKYIHERTQEYHINFNMDAFVDFSVFSCEKVLAKLKNGSISNEQALTSLSAVLTNIGATAPTLQATAVQPAVVA